MNRSTARNIALTIKILAGAGIGLLTIGNIAGGIIAGILAYVLVVSIPRPFTTFRESLRVNWRSFCVLGGLLGLAVEGFAFHLPEAIVVLRCFSAGFVGVLVGEMIGGILVGMAKDSDSSNDKKN
jgi:hypothetical protein